MLDTYLFKKHLDDDEVVSQYVHKYWGVASSALFWPSVSLIAGIAFLIIAPVRTVLYIVIIWSLIMTQWWLRNFLDYFLDVWIITDQGVIALAWEGWFHRTSMRTLYSDIQGVSYEINGIMGTLNGYGTLSMEKISTGGKVSLSHVRYPRKIQALILQNMESYLHKKNLKNAKHVQDLLAEFVAEKIQLSDIQGTEKHSAKEQTSGIIIRKV